MAAVKNTYTFTTDNPAVAERIMAAMGGDAPTIASVTSVAPPVVATPAPAPAAPPAPVAPPVAPPAPVAPTAQHGAPPPGWTIQHVTGALQALGANPAKGGPAGVKALLAEFGATKVTDVDPARWPELHSRATAA